MANIRFGDNDNTILASSSDTFFGEGGDDVYVLSQDLIPANASIEISDTEGANRLRLLDGLEIASSELFTLADGVTTQALLTLSNGATVTIFGANSFDYDVGGELSGAGATPQDFATFVTDTLGTTVPAANSGTTGGPVTVAQPEVSIADASVLEGDPGDANRLVFTVSLDQVAASDVTVTFSTVAGGTASNSTDFTPLTQQVTIPVGLQAVDVVVDVTGDSVVEADETVEAVIVNPNGATLGDASATGTIVNDDAAGVSLSDASVVEGDAGAGNVLRFTVSLDQPSSQDVTVDFATLGSGTATAGTDFTAVAQPVTIPAGQTTATVDVAVTGDDLVEGAETVDAEISNAAGAVIADATGTGTIQDDDLPTLSIAGASVAEGDPGDSTQLAFQVTLSEAVSEEVSFTFEVGPEPGAADPAEAGGDFTVITQRVTIPAGATTATVNVDVSEDLTVEGDETVEARIFDPSANASIATGTAIGTIENDDLPTVSVNDVSAVEGDSGEVTSMTFTVSLSEPAPAAGASVEIASVQTGLGLATPGVDFTALLTTPVSFAEGEQTEEVTIDILGDDDAEVAEFVRVALSNAVGAVIDDGSGEGTILDDDGAFVLTTGTDTITPTENSTAAQQPPPPSLLPDGSDNRFIADQTTLNAADVLDGGGNGADADELFVSSDRDSGTPTADTNFDGRIDNNDRPAVNLGGSTIRDIETIRVQANFDPVDVDLSGATGITGNTLVNDNSNTSVTFDAVDDQNPANGVPDLVGLELRNLTGSQDTRLFYLSEATDPLLAGPTTQSIRVVDSDVGLIVTGGNLANGDNTATGIEAIELDVTGGASEIGGIVNDSLTSLTVTGDQNLTLLDLTPQADLVGTVGGSAPADPADVGGTGALGVVGGTFTYDGGANDAGNQRLFGVNVAGVTYAVTTGDSDDVIDMRSVAPQAQGTFNSDDDFDLGGGTDRIIVDEVNATDNDTINTSGTFNGNGLGTVANTEVLQVVDGGNAGIEGEIQVNGQFGGFQTIELRNDGPQTNGANGDGVVGALTGVGPAGLFVDDANDNLTLMGDFSGGAGDMVLDSFAGGTFNVDFATGGGNHVVNNFTYTDGQVLNLTFDGGGSVRFANVNLTAAETLTRSGNAAFTAGDGDLILFEDNSPNLSRIDATGSTGFNDFLNLGLANGGATLLGGSSTDLFAAGNGNGGIGGTEQNDSIEGNGGNDTVFFENSPDFDGNDTVKGGDGSSDTIHILENQDLIGSPPVLQPRDIVDAYFVNVDSVERLITSDRSEDVLFDTNAEGAGIRTVELRDGNDLLDASSFGAGSGLQGAFGQNGNDTILGGDGNDVNVFGDAGNDSLVGNAGNDRLFGGADNDIILGGTGDDEIEGGSGNDVLSGGDDNDSLEIGLGTDNADFGAGNDVLTVVGFELDANDTIAGGTGTDEIRVNEGGTAVLGGFVSGIETVTAPNTGGVGTTNIAFGAAFNQKEAITVNLEGSANDTRVVDASGNDADEEVAVNGSLGTDLISGGAGDDTLSGNDGNDQITGGGDADQITGGRGNDILIGGSGSDTILGGEGDDTLFGGEGADLLDGESGTDVFFVPDAASSGFPTGIDTVAGFDFDNAGNPNIGDKIALGFPPVGMPGLDDLEVGTATVAFANNAADLNASNNIQAQFTDDNNPDAVVIKVVAGALQGFHLLVEGADPLSFNTADDAVVTLGGVDPALAPEDLRIDITDFVSAPFITTEEVDDNPATLEPGNALDQTFTFTGDRFGDGDLDEPLDGGLGTDTLVLDPALVTDLSTNSVTGFEILDGNGAAVTVTETQLEQFTGGIQNVPAIIVDDLNGNQTIVGDDNVGAYTVSDIGGRDLDFTLASIGGVIGQDLTVTGTTNDTIRANGATKLTDAQIDAGGGDDVFEFDSITDIDPSTVNGNAGNDTFNIADLATLDDTSTLIGGTGNDTFNGGAALTIGGANPGTLDGGADDDTATLGAVTLAANGSLLGGAGANDALTLNGTSDLSAGTFTGWETVALAVGVNATMTGTQHDGIGTLTGAGTNTVTLTDAGDGDITGAATIADYVYTGAGALTFRIGADGQDYTGSDAAADTVDLSGTAAYAGTVRTGDGADAFTGIAGLAATAVLEGGLGDDTFTVTGDLLQSAEIDGGIGTDTLVIETGGNPINISGVNLDDIENLEINGTGTVSMTRQQHQTFLGNITAAGATTIQITDGGTLTGDLEVETYLLSPVGNTFTVDGPNTDNSGQRVIGGAGDDIVNFTAEDEIVSGELDIDGNGGTGDVLNLDSNGFAVSVRNGDVREFETYNVTLTGFDFDFESDPGNQPDPTTMTFTGTVGAGNTLNIEADDTTDFTVSFDVINGADHFVDLDGGDDTVTIRANEAALSLEGNDNFRLGGGTDSLILDVNGNDVMVNGASDIDAETFSATGTSASAGGLDITLDSTDDILSLDFSAVTNGVVLNALNSNDLTDVRGSQGSDSLGLGQATTGFTVDLQDGGADDVLLDTDGVAANLVTVTGFGNDDDVLLNGPSGSITFATNVTMAGVGTVLDDANGGGGATINTVALLTNFANAQVAAPMPGEMSNLVDLSVGGAVRTALLEGALDGTGATAGEFYAALDDGTDTGIYRVQFDSDIGGAADTLDFSADIIDIDQVALIDDFVITSTLDFT